MLWRPRHQIPRPGLRRLNRLGPKASGHRKGEQREPTQGLGGALQRRQHAHHKRLAYQQQYKAYIKEEDSNPDTSRTLDTENWPDSELAYIRMDPSFTQVGNTCVVHAATK